jgi:RHS repeat-associated protein
LTEEYFYDNNGNMYRDKNKGIDLITYNHLNLPTTIVFNHNLPEEKSIGYIYTSTGSKLRKYTNDASKESTTTDYIGAFVYEEGELQFIQTAEGRLVPDGSGGYNYEYAIKDHLGNTRVMFDENGQILQDESYYPFGLSFGAELSYVNTLNSPKNKYLYNGKEKQMDFDLGWYDYGARFYNPELGRWSAIDPLLEKYTNNSPYNYVLNRPLIAFDPDGMRYASYESDEGGRRNYGVKKGNYGVKERFEGPPQYTSFSFDENGNITLQGNTSDNKAKKTETSKSTPLPLLLGMAKAKTSSDSFHQFAESYTQGEKEKKSSEDASGQGGSWAVTAAQTSLSFMTADVMVLDPSDAAAVYKLIGYGVVATAAWAVLYFNGTSNYPGPWSTDRPKNYIPAPLNGPNNRNYFPQGNGNDFIKWTIRLGGASVLGKKLYDGFNLQPNFMPSDNTNFVNPTPPPMPPFYTPKPNPNRP